MRLLPRLAPLTLIVLSGCHSAFVEATVVNHTADPIPLIEVAYPSASFGTQNLLPGQEFHYRFKVLGSGPVKVVYTDHSQQEKRASGPTLREGAEGSLRLSFDPSGVHWQTTLAATR